MLQFEHYQLAFIIMPTKITLTNEDGSTTDFFQQSYTDAAVATAVAAVPAAPVVAPEDTEVDITRTDGSVVKFIPAPTA
jgi:hypothetical protein